MFGCLHGDMVQKVKIIKIFIPIIFILHDCTTTVPNSSYYGLILFNIH
jgi:hypothetical protein